MKYLVTLLIVINNFASAQTNCDSKKLPIVFIHGFLASGDTYADQVNRFKERLYCADRLFVYDWNSIAGFGKRNDSLLNGFINNVLKITGAAQIDLVAHSAGGVMARGYLLDSVNASKVAHFVNLGSRKWFYEYSWFPNKKCLNIYSDADKAMGSSGGVIEGAENLNLKDKDHYEVATCAETFKAINAFLNEKKPGMDYAIFEKIEIAGKAVLLGTNSPMINAKVKVYRLQKTSGARISQTPDAVFSTNQDGGWGTFTALKKFPYEIELTPADKKERVISYFFEPFTHTDKLIYLRGFPAGNMIGVLLGKIPQKADQSVIVIYSAKKAIIGGRDSVTVNGIPVSSTLLTPETKTVVSNFIFDDGDNKTSGEGLKQFSSTPFLSGVDIRLPVLSKKGHFIYFNGRTLVLPAVASKDRILLAVFK